MKKITALFAVAAILSAVSPASALEWTVLGPRALGMGGAGVADAQGPLASYWNPGALGLPTENSYGLAIPVDAHVAFDGQVLAGAKALQDIHGNNCGAGGCTQAQVDQAYSDLSQVGTGLRVDAGAGANLKVGKIAVFLDGFVDIGGVPLLDNNPADKTVAAIQNGTNNTQLIIKGARIAELGAGYGHEVFVPGLYLGADVKVMKAQVGYSGYDVFNNDANNSNIVSTLKNNSTESSNFGLDAGALWDVDKTIDGAWWQPHVGLVGRNLNNPKFSQPEAATQAGLGRFAVNPQVRLGVSISPFNWWHFASDVDLTRNLTPVDGVASREFGVGTEVDVFNRTWINIPLRVGVSRNLAESGAATAFTAGTGVNLLHLIVDVSGMVTPKTVTQDSIDGQNTKVPQEIAGAVSLSFLFGGSSDTGRRHHDDSAANDSPMPSSAAGSNLDQSSADRVRADAARSQQELNNQSNH